MLRNSLEADAKNITVRTRAATNAVEVIVQDDGCGIPIADLKRLFEPFLSKGGSETLGLGLTISHSVIVANTGCCSINLAS